MPTYRAPQSDFRFLLTEWLKLGQQTEVPGFADAAELAAPLIEEGAKLCENVLFPLNQSGDEEGCRWEDGNVYMPKGFKEAYAQYVAGGWPAFTCEPEFGGQGLPEVLNMPITEMICSANLSFGLTPGLSHSAYNLMTKYCPDALKPRFMPKLTSGEWSGVMCLTEPQCGTDLGLIRTKATPNSDGTYAIEGTKIFISSGEQDLTENILHLVLAKLPDAPKGVKGISLFLVPKIWVNEDGTLGERNAVKCASIEHKMGIHGSSTCVMNYDGAKGYLIGQPHRGLPAMFTMMNAARIYVGVQGLGVAEAAYQGALAYANERLQGRAMKGPKHPEKPADPITVHPDVRRMLLTIRAFCEGSRALVLLTAMKHDLAHRHPDAAAREEADDFVQLMTPIVKAYLTDGGTDSANLAMQCLGGYGYIREYGIEQYARDARIAQIYEGTNGIQALDLVGRKLSHKYGKYLRAFFHPVQAFIDDHAADPHMQEFIKPLEKHLGYLRQASLWIAQKGLANPDDAAAASVEYLRLFALVVMAWIWAQQAKLALQHLGPLTPALSPSGRGSMDQPSPLRGEGGAAAPGEGETFYREKLATARFFYARILPQTISLLACLTAGSKPLMEPNLEVA